ncbi:superfamily II DNA or RNA helicase [Mycolicibacterium iranicum]|uniref:Superfamily II DNA or RNA helicase n=1 Tax=Mycolicibacterium iranicum TaxID=912594 RepID=A0A839Q8U5_MYCIR|nr:SNF2-related protein [Mycolicibacterium iranicum]MBB2989642.1 superfamily II DNA or RNA helicase [Mycolicibacterium iranicum]
MIEKRITHQLLETGELGLTERECAALLLPEHSSSIQLELESEPFLAQWNGRSRQLTGDLLTERLQDYGQDGGLLRLRLVGQVYRLQLLPPGTRSEITVVVSPPTPVVKSTAAKAKRRRATVDRQFQADTEYDWGNSAEKAIGFLRSARELLAEQLKAAGFDPLELVELRLQGEELATLDDFDELLAVDVSNVDRMPHQEAVARHALSRLRGRAILADEVGLGKTIEAGLAVQELTLRGLAKRVLILCPAPLRDQWREEMSTKFDLAFEVAARGPEVGLQDKLILSMQLARNNADVLTKKPWDIVILDEAHRAAGSGARKTRDLITALTTSCRYALFLTATPVQNDLLELYRLVELLRPGTFTSVSDFKRQFMTGYDPRTPKDPAALRRLISSVMIRTTRAQAGVDRVVRKAVDVPITLGAREHELYALATDLLRNVMRDRGDAMRRRSLALRLTASPFSMGTTALRMAERHPDARVREVLHEIGHLAMDIKGSAREDRALQITRKWLGEHGRVLIFTQHTDTVTGLLRRIDAEGLTARAFHGSMSATERANTIAAFRSGNVPIMISTDAGAEGQNLQFCNCVLNYDLPWNPMRIEQRIGRVDRLTQPKDEVFVANLYAQKTIDESVFRLLAEKLRMFELLFGQVTTILGELDDSKAASFETRVMEALFADNDSKMNTLLNQLGTELIHAREKASELIAADSGMSQWMTSAFEHRKGLTKAGSTDLAPEVSERARMRQRRVQTWVRNVLRALDVRIVHDTGEGDGAFLTASFDEEFEQELGGRTTMHLAFDRFGLEHHPDAELCAVGSPVFDELLGLLRVRGDMHATVPVIPDDIGPSPYRHGPSISLVRRRLVPTGSWSGQATFRATVGEAATTEHLITADLNGHQQQQLPRRPLQDGESLPASFGTAPTVIAKFERAASSQLEKLRRERARSVEKEQNQELARVTGGYKAQIAEATGEDRARLHRALRSEERRLTRAPDVRARAKVLAVTLDEDDWLVEEAWVGPSGDEKTLTYQWGIAEPPAVDSAVTGCAIGVLALCSEMHWIDDSETTHCSSCDRWLCGACGDDAVFEACPVCDVQTCGRCRRQSEGLCLPCASPDRVPELDDEYAIAWKMNRDSVLHVGERVCTLTRRASGAPTIVVDTADLQDPRRARLRAYAQLNGLPLDCGLTKRDLTNRDNPRSPSRTLLHSTREVTVELSTIPSADSSLVLDAIDDIPVAPEVSVVAETDFALGSLLTKLRHSAPPPMRPSVLVTHRSHFVDTYIEDGRLVRESCFVTDDGALEITDVHAVDIDWCQPTLDDTLIGSAEIDGLRVRLHRRNEAVLVTAERTGENVGEWIICPDEFSAAEQLGCYEHLRVLGTPGGRLGKRTDEVLTITGDFPSPTECAIAERSIRPIADLVELAADAEIVPADSASLSAFGIQPDPAVAQQLTVIAGELATALASQAERPFTAALCNGLEVRETWQGHGTGTHVYQTFDGTPLAPRVDDVGIRKSDFGVCRDGHFYAASTAALCAACETWACRACDELEHLASIVCPGCTHGVCRRCLTTSHKVCDVRCLLCDDHACADCGRDPTVTPCAMCDRTMCGSCRVDDLCPACTELAPLTEDLRSRLPKELAAEGASVYGGSDADALVVIINRGSTYEQAIVRDRALHRWVAFDRSLIDEQYRLRLAASRALHTQVYPTTEPLPTEIPRTEPRVVVNSRRSFHAAWSVPAIAASGRSPHGQPTADGDLATAVVAQFPPMAALPEPVSRASARLQALLHEMGQPSAQPLSMRWERSGFDVAIVPAGISDITIDNANEQETIAEWQDAEQALSWVIDAWHPSPTIHKIARLRNTEAAIVGMAGLAALGVRTGDELAWFAISASEHAPAATLLSRHMGLGDSDEVGVFTDRKAIKLSGVSNATAAEVSVVPHGRVRTGPRTQDDSTLDALSCWLPGERVTTPPLAVLPNELRLLLRKNTHQTPRSRLEIGTTVEQIVAIGDQQWRYEVSLAPGQTDARRPDQNTRQLLDVGEIDRQGHFGSRHERCGYCEQLCCAACVDGIVTCDCCTSPICKRCVREPSAGTYFCHACASTRPPTRKEARQHGRLMFTRGMLIGTDSLHTVVVEQSKSHWGLHGADGEKQIIANPSVTRYLEQRLTSAVD